MFDPTTMPALTGKEFARERRRAISLNGGRAVSKKGAAGGAASGRDNSRVRPTVLPVGGKNGAVPSAASTVSVAAPMIPEIKEKPGLDRAAVAENTVKARTTPPDGATSASSSPSPVKGTGKTGRDLCRARRQALSVQGKGAIVSESKSGAPLTAQRNGRGAGAASGREFARLRRAQLCQTGRGDAAGGRPSERLCSETGAPPAVAAGTTLSGQPVTGTQVDRAPQVTGNEPGTCRVITGTEYIGAEQFESFCEARPMPGAAKVGMSVTSRGQWVSGTEVGRSIRVTGDEHGSCKPVTGTEYLGSERFGEFCQSKGLVHRPEKVSIGVTARSGVPISGNDEVRVKHVTGAEAGAMRAISGSQYADVGVARLTINGSPKVALTHTLAGRPVSGTEVGRSMKVTGDEAGSCRAISGTEYLSNEQFSSICKARPEPTPAKVGEDVSRAGQRITGNVLDRTDKVTGNEPGLCQRVTGAQYEQSALCGGVEKVARMGAPGGRIPTGSRAGHDPKSIGDEHCGCEPVTGTEYDGQGRSAKDRLSTPPLPVAKVRGSHTACGLAVSGSMQGRSERVTGDEPGSGLPITGTSYAGREQPGGGCHCGCSAGKPNEVARAIPPRYRAPANQAQPLAEPMTESRADCSRPDGFSIVSPAREAHGRITGSAYGGAGRITGPVNMAAGLVSGTPEFRYQDDIAAPPKSQVQELAAASRITGAGRETGQRITGDDWARNGRVTGTEGRWAQGRNPTLKGQTRGMGATAWANKKEEHQDVPLTKVTGSSGNAGKGALITVSGGARG
ncbi:MAG: CsoS2 family carboxysome shell protein [Acidiferrobacter sp.]